MEYFLNIKRFYCDNRVVHGLKTWPEVTNYLRNHLDSDTELVMVSKYSSDGRTLGRKLVNMSNIVKVATSLRDNILTSDGK